MNQTVFQTYSEAYGVRFSKRQKKSFEAAITKDFEALGYSCGNISGRKLFKEADNIVFGNLKHAKTIIAVPYDTPQRIFWWNSDFYPLDGMATTNKMLLPVFVPILILYLILLGIVYGIEGIITDETGIRIVMIVVLLAIIGLFYVMMHGIANRKNYCRNSASIAAAYEIAAALNKDQQRTTAFIFLDANKSHHYGAKLVAEELQKQNKNPNIIVLNTFACGSRMQIGYTSQTKKLAQELSKACPEPKRFQTVALNDDMRMSTAMEHFHKAVTIGAGELDKKGRLCFKGSATGKDCRIDEANMEATIAMILAYIHKQS